MGGEAPVAWSDDIEGDAGQLLVANADDFAAWLGADAPVQHGALDAVHPFAEGHSCYVWRVTPGSIRIMVDPTRTFLCLARIEYADNEAGRDAAHAYALAYQSAPAAEGLAYRVSTGPVVVAWSPGRARDTSTAIQALPLSAATPGALIDFATGPNAAALWLAPGLYASSLFYHEEDRWAVSWCRLQRVSD
jgi:hypothetical protein